ncbi:MAG: serpin family protein [Phycisphaerae bacterium]|nr:serpin family protein [Phycisphaerae bacterium]
MRLGGICLALAFSAAGCSRDAGPEPPITPESKAVAEGGNAFALDLYAKLSQTEGNLFFSPYSISAALAMTYAGARGETAGQMAKVLHFATDGDRLHPGFAGLGRHLNWLGAKGDVTLNVANALWAQQGHPFREEFLGVAKTSYDASVQQVDFIKSAEQTRGRINAWVSDRTKGRIKDLVPTGVLDEITRLVLTDAIYFKGRWDEQFDKKHTRDAPFHVTPTKTVTVPMMTHKAEFGYAETDGAEILEMAYEGESVSMVVLLPKEADGLAGLEKSLNAKDLEAWLGRLAKRDIRVFVPRFRMTWQFDLARTLASMGMSDAFDGKADFSGMDGMRDLFIAAVLHKAFVDVNEEGTEAGSWIGITVETLGEPEAFRADRPFLFVIRHRPSGAILFLGRLVKPSE